MALNIRVQAKTLIFFDRDSVKNTMDKRTYRAFNYVGALTRAIAKKSMPNRRQASPPGHPPHSHGRALLRELVYYGIDRADNTVVVGPAATYRGTVSRQSVPEVLEYGGDTWRGNTIAARPYMRPAFGRAVDNKNLQKAFDEAGRGDVLARMRNG